MLLAAQPLPAEPTTPGHAATDDQVPQEVIEQALGEPKVIIRQGKGEQIEEYRVGGQVYMIKVTPAKGPVYFLVDTDGDGRLDDRRSELSADVLIPQWKVLEWK